MSASRRQFLAAALAVPAAGFAATPPAAATPAAGASHFEVVNCDNGDSVVRTWQEGDRPRWRVDIVCDSTGERSTHGEYATKAEADELADWFGREGDLRAEVSPIDGPESPDQASLKRLPMADIWVGAIRNVDGCRVCCVSVDRREVDTFAETFNRINGRLANSHDCATAYVYRASVPLQSPECVKGGAA